MQERARYSSRVSVILTDRCNIQCTHCLPDCGPKKADGLSWAVVERIIRQAHASPGVQTMRFTGGEPFLDLPLLSKAIELCSQLGLESQVMTNGYWAKTLAKAQRVLAQLSGLTHLGLSTDSFHQEFISVSHIENAIRAAHGAGIACAVRVSHLDAPDEEVDAVRRQLDAVSDMYSLECQPVQPLGRAREEIAYERIYSYPPELACCRSADMHAVSARGELTACCGATASWSGPHPLKIGNVRESDLGQLLRAADESFAVQAVRVWGPAGLLRLAQAQAQREGCSLPSPAIHNLCELCAFVVADPERARLLNSALEDPELRKEVALARLRDLGETSSFAALARPA